MKSKPTYGEKKLSRIDVGKSTIRESQAIMASLPEHLAVIEQINAIVLFGSFARGDYSIKHSDIDIMIFLDAIERDTVLEEVIRKKIIALNLEKGLALHTLFQYRKLELEDRSLMLTIAREGKVLFARKTMVISDIVLGLKEHWLLRFDTTKCKPAVKNKLQRFLYGYSVHRKHYHGIVDEHSVLSAGKGAIVLPQEMVNKVLLFARTIGVKTVQKGKFYR